MKKIDKRFMAIIIIFILLYYLCVKYLHIGIPCLFHKITNLYCPGCGITRMFLSIINLDFYQAFRFNPLVFILFNFSIIFLIIDKILWILKQKHLKIPNAVYILLIVIVLMFGILRNIPSFNYLIPTEVK